jgi:hypothetical protein
VEQSGIFVKSAKKTETQGDCSMKWAIALVTALLLVGLSTTEAKAQTITITDTNTKTAGQIIVTAKVAGVTGTINLVEFYARPPKGAAGKGGYVRAKDLNGGNWGGTILVPKNTYDVQAVLTATDGKGNTVYVYSAVVSATVN